MDKQTAGAAALSPTRPLALRDKVYLCRPAKLSDLSGIGIQVRKQAARKQTPLGRLVNDPAWKLLPAQAQVEVAKIAASFQVAGPSDPSGAEMLDGLADPAVLAFAVWLCCKGQHEGLELREVAGQIDDDNAAEVFVLFDEASGMSSLGNAAGPSPSAANGTGGA